jgi:adenylate cyclase
LRRRRGKLRDRHSHWKLSAFSVGPPLYLASFGYGDAVNLAARLEQLNKEYGSRVLVSGTTVELLIGSYPLAPVGEVVVRGKTMPVLIYRLDVPA